jgi:hypothetical protein
MFPIIEREFYLGNRRQVACRLQGRLMGGASMSDLRGEGVVLFRVERRQRDTFRNKM